MCNPTEIAASLTLWQRHTLRRCVFHSGEELRRQEATPRRVGQPYFAYGAEKRAARVLLNLNLLERESCGFEGTGAEIWPSDLGCAVVAEMEDENA